MAEKLDKKALNAITRRTHNRLVLGSAVQIGMDIIRELAETGGLGPTEIKGETVQLEGVRGLLTATLTKDLTTRTGGGV